MNRRKYSFLVMLLCAVFNTSAQSNPEWKMMYPGVWKAVIGKPDAIALLSIADAHDGGIIPMVPPHFHAPAPGEKLALEIRHYGKMPATAELYDDDGISFDYEKGMNSRTKLIVSKNDKGELKGEIIRRSSDKVFSYKDEVVWKFMTSN